MTKKTRRRYTAEFKAAAIARLDETGEMLSRVAQALGVAATQLKTWRLEQQAAGSAEAIARGRLEIALDRGNPALVARVGLTHETPSFLIPGGNRLRPLGHRLEKLRLCRPWFVQRWPAYRIIVLHA